MSNITSSDIPSRVTFDPDPELTDEEYLEALEEHFEEVTDNNEALRSRLDKVLREHEELRDQIDYLQRQNEALKSTPSYVATVKEVMRGNSEEPEAVIEQHGSNQEVVTDLPAGLDVETGDRVAINDSFTPQRVLDPDSDTRTKAMQVDDSPDVAYEDIGGLEDQLVEVREAVEEPLKYRERFDKVGIEPPSGVLLHGPPGTGKTLMAKAVANQTNASFIKLAGSELVQKFIGEGARLVRDLFEVAEQNSPAIIFIDEIDAIASKRTDSKTSGDAEVQRTMMQLLSEMDGFDDRGEIRIMAATNRFDMLDDAILRPGRFDRLIEVGEPDSEAREHIFQIHSRDMSVEEDVDFAVLASETEGFTGADIEAVCTEAGMQAIRNERTSVTIEDFRTAAQEISDQDSDEDALSQRYHQ